MVECRKNRYSTLTKLIRVQIYETGYEKHDNKGLSERPPAGRLGPRFRGPFSAFMDKNGQVFRHCVELLAVGLCYVCCTRGVISFAGDEGRLIINL